MMTEQQRSERLAAMNLEEQSEPVRWWRVVFFVEMKGTFLGVTFVQARGVISASKRCHDLGLDVAGSAVACQRIPEQMGAPPDEIRERLIVDEAAAERICAAYNARLDDKS